MIADLGEENRASHAQPCVTVRRNECAERRVEPCIDERHKQNCKVLVRKVDQAPRAWRVSV